MIEQIRRLVMGLALAGYTSCSSGGGQPPPQPPTPPTPDPLPVCVEGQAHSCWHNPGGGWVYACSTPWVSGGVTNTPAGPASCPTSGGPPPAPPVEGCLLLGNPGAQLPLYVSPRLRDGKHLGDHVNDVMAGLTNCSIGSRCIITVPPQLWQAHVSAGLRKLSFCSGQHAPESDEISAQHPVTTALEGFHIYSGDGWSDPTKTGTVVWYYTIEGTIPQGGEADPFRGAARPAFAPPAGGLPDHTPTPSPTPAPVPIPAPPAPSPGVGVCGNPLPPKVWTAATLPDGWGQNEIGRPRWMISCGRHGKIIDCVAKIEPRACDYCASIGMGTMPDGVQPRCGCPVRQEGDPERIPCEAYLTGGTRLEARNGATCAFANSNPFQFEQNDGNCRLCSNDGSVCSAEWF